MSLFSLYRSSIFPILLVNFIGILGFSIVVPILIFIVRDFGGNGFIYGLLGATYPFFQFIGAPILGRLSDQIGRKKVLIISQIGTFLSWCLFLIAFSLPRIILWEQDSQLSGAYEMTAPLLLIFFARMLDGFTGGNISVANAYMSDISNDENRSDNFGKMGASTSLGFVIGPALAGLLASTVLGEILPLFLAALVSLAAIFIINFRLKESNPCVVDTGGLSLRNFREFFQVETQDCYSESRSDTEPEQSKGWQGVLNTPRVPILFGIYFLTFFGFSLFYAGLPVYASGQLEWSSIELGAFLAYFSFAMILVQGPLLSYISPKCEAHVLVWAGALILALGFFILSGQNIYFLYLGVSLMALGNGLMWPSFLNLLSQTGSPERQGSIQGYGSSVGSMASILGLIMGGFLVVNWGNSIFILASFLFMMVTLLSILGVSKPLNTMKASSAQE